MKAWIVFVVAGVGTYLARGSFLLAGSALELPGWSRRALKYVAPAVFAAIVAPPVFGDDGLAGVTRPDARLLAVVLATAVAYRTRDVKWVLVVGMLALWVLRWLGL